MKKFNITKNNTYGLFVDQNRSQAHSLSPNIDYTVVDNADVESNNQQ